MYTMTTKQAHHIKCHLEALKDQAYQRAAYAKGAAAQAYMDAADSCKTTYEHVRIADAKPERALRSLDLATQHAGVALMYFKEAGETNDSHLVMITANIEKRLKYFTEEEAAAEARRKAAA